jgi:hypothetical protein
MIQDLLSQQDCIIEQLGSGVEDTCPGFKTVGLDSSHTLKRGRVFDSYFLPLALATGDSPPYGR